MQWMGPKSPPSPQTIPNLPTSTWGHGVFWVALCFWCLGCAPAQLIEMAHPGLSVHLPALLTAGNCPGVPRFLGQAGPTVAAMSISGAWQGRSSCWLALGMEVAADAAVGISWAGLQCCLVRPGASGTKGRKGPLFSQIISHDAA